MNYELAKKLKDVGFPQKRGYGTKLIFLNGNKDGTVFECTQLCIGWGKKVRGKPLYDCCCCFCLGMDVVNQFHPVYIPTLEELIEACGDRFGNLILRKDGMYEVCSSELNHHAKITDGKTPLEAVCNLYIALNAK